MVVIHIPVLFTIIWLIQLLLLLQDISTTVNISSTLRLITAAVAIYVMIINDAMTKRWRWQTEMCGDKKIDAQSRAE